MARLVPGLARVVGVDTGQLYSLARDAEGGVLGGAGPADQGGIEDLAGAVLVTATGLLAHREREAAPRPARKAGTTLPYGMIPILPHMATLEIATPMQTATRPSLTTFFCGSPQWIRARFGSNLSPSLICTL